MTLPQQPTDTELIAAVRAGDDEAFRELHRRHVGDTRRVALLVTRSADEADMVVSDAFRHLYVRSRESGGPDGELKPYLRTVVRRLAFDGRRWTSQGTRPDQLAIGSLDELSDPRTVAPGRDLVRKAYETLPPRWQEVLWWTEVEGQSPDQLSGPLDDTPNAVASLALRAREGLRQAYLSMYVTGSIRPECRPFVPMIPALTRGTLTAAEESAVNDHIDGCPHCRDRRAEMLVLFSNLRSVLVPALVGRAPESAAAVADRYGVVSAVAGGSRAGPPAATDRSRAAGAASGGRTSGSAAGLRRRPGSAGVVTAAAGMVTAAVLTVVMLTTVLDSTPRQPAAEPPIVSAPTDDYSAAELTPSPTLETERDAHDDLAEPDQEPVTSGTAPGPATTQGRAESPATAAPSTDEPFASGGDSPAADDPSAPPGPAATAPPADARLASADDPSPTSGPPSASRSAAGPATSGAPPSDDASWGPQAPPWWCDLVPNWPGCPDNPEPPGRDSLCARFPELPFCPADGVRGRSGG